jgi:tape measure domain-containing protein
MANEEIVVQLRAEIQGFKTQLQQATDAIGKFTQEASDKLKQPINPMNQLSSSVMNLATGYISLQAAVQLVGKAFNQSLRLDSVKSALTAVLGSTELADAKLQEISQSADNLGLNFLDLATSYKNFAAAALSSNQTLGDTDKIFNSVTKAAAVLKLSAEDVKGTLNALGQMFSKGQVSAEELRQQLGERLPGAVALMAAGLGVSTKALNKMLEQGQITTAAVVKLAGQLDLAYGNNITGKVDTLQSSVERLNNTFTKGVDAGGLGKFFKFWIDGINQIIETLEHAYLAVTNFGKSFAAIEFESCKEVKPITKTIIGYE